MGSVNRIIEITFTLVLVFLILSNGQAFSMVANTVGSIYVNSVRALQGQK